jgi:peroxiredoxin
MESQAEVEQFMQANGLSFPVLLDPNGSAFSGYAIRYIPTTFFIDAGGVIQQKKIGSFESEAEIQSYLSAIMP